MYGRPSAVPALLTDKSLIVPQINQINEFIRPQLVPNSLNKEEFGKYVNFINFPNFALKP